MGIIISETCNVIKTDFRLYDLLVTDFRLCNLMGKCFEQVLEYILCNGDRFQNIRTGN